MKRSEVVEIISFWAKPEILQDVYDGDLKQWADNLLFVLEVEVGMRPPEIVNVNYGPPSPPFDYDWEDEE